MEQSEFGRLSPTQDTAMTGVFDIDELFEEPLTALPLGDTVMAEDPMALLYSDSFGQQPVVDLPSYYQQLPTADSLTDFLGNPQAGIDEPRILDIQVGDPFALTLGQDNVGSGGLAGNPFQECSASIMGTATLPVFDPLEFTEYTTQAVGNKSLQTDDILNQSASDKSDTPGKRRRKKVHKSQVVENGLPLGHRPTVPLDKPWIRIDNKSKGLNRRSAMIDAFRPEKVYDPLPHAPNSWRGFEYTKCGELAEAETYSVDQIRDYLYNHPLHTLTEDGTRRLQIRIQRLPVDSARRYPTSTSSRCRFAGCFAAGNRILPGNFRVCFDEQSWQGNKYDPFLNAGYVHLFCLERFMNFPQIVQDLNVIPERRELLQEARGMNRMSLGRGAVFVTTKKFLTACRNNQLAAFAEDMKARMPGWNFNVQLDGSLTQLLNIVKLLDETPTNLRTTFFEKKDYTFINEHHLGDLIRYRKQRGQKGRKRLAGAATEDDDNDDEEDGDVVELELHTKKRSRRS